MEQTIDTRGIVDTDILIDGQRRRDDARDFLARQRRVVGLEISVISAMELVKGCQNALALARVEQFLRVVRVLPISGTASQVAYHLIQRFYLSHGLLIPDALIAATALDYGVTLYTKNVRHFRMISGLTVVRPYEQPSAEGGCCSRRSPPSLMDTSMDFTQDLVRCARMLTMNVSV